MNLDKTQAFVDYLLADRIISCLTVVTTNEVPHGSFLF